MSFASRDENLDPWMKSSHAYGPSSLSGLLITKFLQDMFVDQKRQIQNLTTRLEMAMKERHSYEEKTSHLQQVHDLLSPSNSSSSA